MVGSLSRRIVVLCSLLCLLTALLAGLLLQMSSQMHGNLAWVTHSSQVLKTANRSLSHLRVAESGQRGFTLTRDPAFARSVEVEIAGAKREASDLVHLTADNPAQNMRAKQISALVSERANILEETVRLARSGDFAGAQASTATGQGRDLMELVGVRIDDFVNEERMLAKSRFDAVERRLKLIRWLVLAGTPLTMIALALVAIVLIRGIRQPVEAMMTVMGQLGAGDRAARVTARMNSREFERLANGYNAMADELQAAVADQIDSQERLRVANLELSQNAAVLRERGEVIELLGGMAHRMQAARTDEELASIIRVFVPRVLHDIPGALYAHNNSRNLLVPVAAWGGLAVDPSGFAPEQCWALRRGQSHFVVEPGSDIVCAHTADETHHYHCEPLLAGGEVIGVLYLKGVIGSENRFRLAVLTENIASALVNHRLQRGLREQTIRDPLTGLFNRRYMEETLALEIARASRSGSPLALVMCDVDHFKRFNDEFGHDAGDAVLQTVAAELRSRFRDGDVICRFGGEEFIVIAPDTAVSVLMARVEEIRQAVSEITVQQGGRTLGSITMSFGIASWDPGMDREGTMLLKVADTALYEAKRAGRNRVVTEAKPLSLSA
ncbi:diguanylate cyclase (GGDEF) domain-containing protein [Novosphingobium sp. CF614]|uniref:diguanylate cyclase n=1 Tax=Novosphingobium sp. CF614 TaxID=1884364 RepID=UPI0008DFF80F|nr:diguanylate cyclase [Novosphingobium sp. CF614]SFG03517.1 diguanylate cyclase (GGDEF) domain-containing protein [Novosphingobium sp. CF614]